MVFVLLRKFNILTLERVACLKAEFSGGRDER